MKKTVMYLLKNCQVFSPEPRGRADVLLAGGKIVAIEPEISLTPPALVERIDCEGLLLTPGFIDAHVHIAGAGGEGGPSSRTPEMQLKHMIEAGVTTVVGCLGTDGFTRSFESVLMKVKSIREQGASAWMYAGAYQVPTPSLTGDAGRDISLIDEVVGIGEIALSDHRSSHPSTHELIRLAAHARIGGMLGGKAGILNIHMGDAHQPFKPLYDAVSQSELTFKQFLPTHCNRNPHIFEDSKTYGKQGFVDITTSSYPCFPDIEIKPSRAVKALLDAAVPIEHITMTSDGFGSLPHFNEKGELVKLEMGTLQSVYTEWVDLVKKEKLHIEDALKPITSNPASILKLPGKGRVLPGFDADLLLLDNELRMVHSFANGRQTVKNGEIIIKGTYE